ncbi:hypothetical protein VTI28DRAFT_4764 [Corynascus sepedonium]
MDSNKQWLQGSLECVWACQAPLLLCCCLRAQHCCVGLISLVANATAFQPVSILDPWRAPVRTRNQHLGLFSSHLIRPAQKVCESRWLNLMPKRGVCSISVVVLFLLFLQPYQAVMIFLSKSHRRRSVCLTLAPSHRSRRVTLKKDNGVKGGLTSGSALASLSC